MTASKYVQPELGRSSLTLLLLLLSVSTALFLNYCLGSANRTTPGPVHSTNSNLYPFFVVGLIYGWTAAGSWLLSCIERRYFRWVLQVGLVVIFASLLQEMRQGEWIRFFSSLGGLVFSQAMIFHLLGMPRWRINGSSAQDLPNRNENPTRQFGIGDILASTTCIAFLLAIMIRYQPNVVGSASYWLTLLAFWAVAPLNAAFMMMAILGSRQRGRRIGWVLLSIGTTMLCAAGLTVAEVMLNDRSGSRASPLDFWKMAPQIGLAYGTLLMTIIALFATLASLGRASNSKSEQNGPESSRPESSGPA